jgi:hypothetical protein
VAKKTKSGPIATTFKDAVVPVPGSSGNWGGHQSDPAGPGPTKGKIKEVIGPVPIGGAKKRG